MKKEYEEVLHLLKNNEEISPEQEVLLFEGEEKLFCSYVASHLLGGLALDAILQMPDDKANKWMLLYMENAGVELLEFSDAFALQMIQRADDATLMAMCGRVALSEKQQLAVFNRPDAKKFIMHIHQDGCGVEGQALQKAEDLGWL